MEPRLPFLILFPGLFDMETRAEKNKISRCIDSDSGDQIQLDISGKGHKERQRFRINTRVSHHKIYKVPSYVMHVTVKRYHPTVDKM